MIKGLAVKVISHFFSRYIDAVDSSQLELEIWNGKARLENVKILPDSLASHDLPFTVTNGTIGAIGLSFPWNRLSSEPCEINIENIFIVATITGNVIVNKDLEAQRAVAQLHDNEETVSEGGTISSILSKIIDNIQFHIKNLHIRVELPVRDSIVAIGVTIASINAFSVNEALEAAFIPIASSILRKKVEISKFSIYIDTNDFPMHIEGFEDAMERSIYDEHQYLLRPFTCNGILLFHRDLNNDSELLINTNDLALEVNTLQWKGLMELGRQYEMFNTRRLYSHCGKPLNFPRSQRSSGKWWRYAHRCAITKENKLSFDPTNAYNILVNRKKYVNMTETATSQEIKLFEKKFELNVVLFLRNYAKVIKKHKNLGYTLTPSELEEVRKEQNRNYQAKSFKACLAMDSLSVSILMSDFSPITRFVANHITANYYKEGFNSTTRLNINSLTMYNDISNKFPITLTANKGADIVIISNANEPNDIRITASDILFVVDLQFLNEIVNFFKKERKFIAFEGGSSDSSAKTQIQSVIDSHKGMNLNIQILNTNILLPYQEIESTPSLALNCKEFFITSKPNKNMNIDDFSTLYDKFSFAFNSTIIKIDESELSKPFDASLDLNIALVESDIFEGIKAICNFPNIQASISTYQYLLLLNIIFYLIDSIESLILGSPEFESNQPKSPQLKSQQKTEEVKKHVSKDLYQFLFGKIDLNIEFQNNVIFTLLLNDFILELLMEEFTQVKLLFKNINAIEYLTSSIGSDFCHTDNLTLDYSQSNLSLTINNILLLAKQKCVLYILEFFSGTETFETRMGFEKTFDYQEIKHKSIPSNKSSELNIDIKINNPIIHIINNVNELGILLANSLDIALFLDDFYRLEIYIHDSKLSKNVKDSFDNYLELTGFTFFKMSPINLQLQIDNPININISEEHLISLGKYLTNIYLPSENEHEGTYPMKRFNINVNSIRGEIDNAFKFGINKAVFTSNNPSQLIFSIESIFSNYNEIPILNIDNFVIQLENEIIEETQISDEITKEKIQSTHDFVTNENDIHILVDKRFAICSSKISVNSNSIEIGLTPEILKMIPQQVNRTDENQCENESQGKLLEKKVKPVNKASSIICKYQPIVNIGKIGVSLYETSKKAMFSFGISHIDYNTKTVNVDSFSLIYNDQEKIAFCGENFISWSDVHNMFSVGDISVSISLNYAVIFAKYIQKFQSIIKFSNKSKNDSKNEMANSDGNTKNPKNSSILDYMNLITHIYSFKSISLLIIEDNNQISIKTGFIIAQNQLCINDMSASLLSADSQFPILESLTMQCHIGDQYKFVISPVILNVALGDIMLLKNICNKFADLFSQFQDKSIIPEDHLEYNDEPKKLKSFSLYQKFVVSPLNSKISLCFNDRAPFLTLNMNTTEYDSIKQDDVHIDTSLIYYNADTGNQDKILEPFKTIIRTKISENENRFEISSTPIILNLHVPFLKRFLLLVANKEQEISIEYHKFEFVNQMGTPISIKVGSNSSPITIPEGSSIPFNQVNENTLVTVKFGLVHLEKFLVGQLFYPIALSMYCIVYRKNNQIIISSPFCIENTLDFPVSIFSVSSMKTLGDLEPNERLPIPSSIDLKAGFYITVKGCKPRLPVLPKSESASFHRAHQHFSFEDIAKSSSFCRDQPPNEIIPYIPKSWNSSNKELYAIKNHSKTFLANIRQHIFKNMIGVIEISPFVTVINELPFKLNLFILEMEAGEQSVESGKTLALPIQSRFYKDELIYLKFASETFNSNSHAVPITLTENLRTHISMDNLTRSFDIIAQTTISSIDSPIKIFVYSPAIIYNYCGFELNVRRTRKSKHQTLKDTMMWGSPGFALTGKLKLQIQCQVYNSKWQNEKIDCTTLGISSTIFLPTENPDVFVPIHHTTNNAGNPFTHTSIIAFSPSLMFVNETDFKITLIPCPCLKQQQFWLTINPHEKTPIIYSTINSQFFLRVNILDVNNPNEKHVKIILASPIRQTFRVNSEFIEMETVRAGGGLSCHIRLAKMPTPIVFKNCLKDIEYSIYQIDEDHPIVVPPQKIVPFAYDEPFGENSVHLDIAGKKLKVSLSSNSDPIKIDDTDYYIQLKTASKGHRIFVICERECKETKYEVNYYLSLSLQSVVISLITQNFSELCLITFQGIDFKSSANQGNCLYELTLNSFQIDDQSNVAAFPVFLIGNSNEKAKFLHLSAISYRDAPIFTSFKTFEFSLQKIDVFADIAFLSDLEALFKSITEDHYNYYAKSITLDLNSNETHEEENSVGQIFSFGSFTIHPIVAHVTFRARSGRPLMMRGQLMAMSPFMRLIPNITNSPIALKSFQMDHFLAPFAFLKQTFYENYKNQIILKLFRAAGHTDLLFNFVGIAESFGHGFKSMLYDPIMANVESPEKFLMATKGTGELLFGTVGSILQGGEGFIRNVSSLISMVGDDDSSYLSTDSANLNAADTVQDGITAFGNGIVDGITGLITKPIEGGKKDGFVGAFTGIAKGLVGAFAKPVAGVLDLSAGVIGGVRKAINNEDGYSRYREPNTYPMAVIGGFDELASHIQSITQKYNKKKKYYAMNLRALIMGSKFIYALFDQRLFFFIRNGCEVYAKAKFSKISNVTQVGNSVRFDLSSVEGNQKIMFNCRSQEESEKFVVLLSTLVSFGLNFNT
ncbi:hypothetical protein TRFO_27685 [Tritrichomonas foetus]|uniref:Chorein N-terminal domain-containing protein n=1 Tax=Tritrichomonas foetus TaxID=1144522 RepID=A0A1J4K1M3_9EUKA|nr:hypothetical protein TRFO_27685 [Tritrichomonas foetus]|eukprot:OHT04688.1 hypothetical protein TRFO_27685 [Tritrichomonas foetus]